MCLVIKHCISTNNLNRWVPCILLQSLHLQQSHSIPAIVVGWLLLHHLQYLLARIGAVLRLTKDRDHLPQYTSLIIVLPHQIIITHHHIVMNLPASVLHSGLQFPTPSSTGLVMYFTTETFNSRTHTKKSAPTQPNYHVNSMSFFRPKNLAIQFLPTFLT